MVDALTRLCKLAALHFMTKRAGDFLRVRSDICIIIIAELFVSIHLIKNKMGICNLKFGVVGIGFIFTFPCGRDNFNSFSCILLKFVLQYVQ